MWTDQSIQSLKDMWAAGKTAREISNALGHTRNAVIGKVHRLHLQMRENPIKNPKPRRKKAALTVLTGVAIADGPQRFHDLQRGQCQFAVTADKPFMFCAQPVAYGRPYCEGHCKASYVISRATPEQVAFSKQPGKKWP